MSFFDYYADALEIMDAGPETEGLGSLSANNGINANTTVGYNLPLSNTNAGGVAVDADGKWLLVCPTILLCVVQCRERITLTEDRAAEGNDTLPTLLIPHRGWRSRLRTY